MFGWFKKKSTPNGPGDASRISLSASEIYDQIFYWQGECFNVSHDEDQPCWLVTVSAPFGVMVHRVFDRQPDPAGLWGVMLEAMKLPQVGDFRRPTRLKVKAAQGWESLKPELQQSGIALEVCEELDMVDGWIEIVDSTYSEWDKRRKKWKVVRRDEKGQPVIVERGLSRTDAELSVVAYSGEDEMDRCWIESDNS